LHYESYNDITGFAYVAAFGILESFQADNYVDFVASWFSSNPSQEHTFMKLMESNYSLWIQRLEPSEFITFEFCWEIEGFLFFKNINTFVIYENFFLTKTFLMLIKSVVWVIRSY